MYAKKKLSRKDIGDALSRGAKVRIGDYLVKMIKVYLPDDKSICDSCEIRELADFRLCSICSGLGEYYPKCPRLEIVETLKRTES